MPVQKCKTAIDVSLLPLIVRSLLLGHTPFSPLPPMGLHGLSDRIRAKKLHILFSGCKKLHLHVSVSFSYAYIGTQNCTVPPKRAILRLGHWRHLFCAQLV